MASHVSSPFDFSAWAVGDQQTVPTTATDFVREQTMTRTTAGTPPDQWRFTRTSETRRHPSAAAPTVASPVGLTASTRAAAANRQRTISRKRPGVRRPLPAGITPRSGAKGAVVRTVVRYNTPAELLLLNKIWGLQSLMTNYFLPQQKLLSKVRDGAKVTKSTTARRPPTAAPRHARQSLSRTRPS
jgi:hypothetical protein